MSHGIQNVESLQVGSVRCSNGLEDAYRSMTERIFKFKKFKIEQRNSPKFDSEPSRAKRLQFCLQSKKVRFNRSVRMERAAGRVSCLDAVVTERSHYNA